MTAMSPIARPGATPLRRAARRSTSFHRRFIEELVARRPPGYAAIAITDECSVAGVVRAHEQAKRQAEAGSPIKLLVGSVFELQGEGATPACRLVLIARHREGYGDLCELITLARLRSPKGQYRLSVRDLDSGPAHLRGAPGCHALLIPRRDDPPELVFAQARWLQATCAERAAIAVELLLHADDAAWSALDTMAEHTGRRWWLQATC
jgi:error-prone DNA polymerase